MYFDTTVVLDSYLRIPAKALPGIRGDIRNRLTLRSKFDENGGVEVFVDGPDGAMGVPIYSYGRDVKKVAKFVDDRRTLGSPISFTVRSSFRRGQAEVLRDFNKYVDHGYCGFIFEAPPGFGKTFCAIKMLERIGTTALVIVPRSNLVEQWVDRIVEHTDMNPEDIGMVSGTTVNWQGKKIVIGLVHSVALLEKNPLRFGAGFHDYFGCTIFDEVDRSVPPATFAPVVGMMPTRYRIGCSATLERGDGLGAIFELHMGQAHIRGADANRMKPTVIIHNFRKRSGAIPRHLPKLNRRGMLLSALASNPARNLVVALYTNLIYRSDRRVLVLSDRTQQLVILRKLMYKRYGIPLEEMGFFTRQLTLEDGTKRNVSVKERNRAASDCKIIFATYGMFSIGSDIKDLAGLVYATPQSHTKQSKGRIERECAGKKAPVIVDIFDTGHVDAMRWAGQRRRLYSAEGLKVKVRE